MEITCPTCRNTFEALTRRATCQHCSTQIDVWALLSGRAAIPAQTIESLTARAMPNLPENVEVASPRQADAYSTSFAPTAESVLDLPANEVVPERSPELEPVLDASFSALPEEFSRSYTKPLEETLDVIPELVTGEATSALTSEPHSGSGRTGWLVTAAVLVLLLAAGIYYILNNPTAPSQVVSETLALPAASELPAPRSSVPAADQPGTAMQTATATPEVTTKAKPAEPPPTGVPAVAATLPSGGEAPSDPATRARAVNPQTLSAGKYTLQIAAKPNEEEARRLAERLIDAGLDARIIKATVSNQGTNDQRTWYRVRVGAFATKGDAVQYGEQLKRAGRIEGYFITDLRN